MLKRYIFRALSVFTAALVLTAFIPFTPAAGDAYAAVSYDEADATVFIFSDEAISVTDGSYTDYSIEGTGLSVKGAGTYVLSGSCADGNIVVKKGTTGVVLILDGLELASSVTAPLTCNKSTEVSIIAKEGTVSTLADSENNNDELHPDNAEAENAVIKCKDGSQVTIGGTGTLNIDSNGKNGIKSGSTTEEEGTASLTIEDLALNIDAAVNDAVNAEATLNVLSGSINISAADDGLHSDYYMNIGSQDTDGPVINIEKCSEGIEAATLKIYSGDMTVYSTDDCINAANSDLSGYKFSIDIYGGKTYMVSSSGTNRSGDGIDSNGSLTLSGGSVEVWTASTSDNQPLDADGSVSITGGTVLAAGGGGGMGMKLNTSQPYVMYGGGQGGGRVRQRGAAIEAASGNIVKSGSDLAITDADGNTVYTGKAACGAGMLLYSSPELISGDTYRLISDGTDTVSVTASTGGAVPEGPGGDKPGRPTAPTSSTTVPTSSTTVPTSSTTVPTSSTTASTISTTAADISPSEKEITRIYGADRYGTAVSIAKAAYDSAENVVIACGGNYPDALAAAPLAYSLNAPVLLADGASLDADTLDEINALGTKNIYIIGGESAVGAAIASSLSSQYNVTRISGGTRFETAAAVAEALAKTSGAPDEIFVASSENYPDALAASPAAAIMGSPILYVDGSGNINSATESFIKASGCKKITVLGGAIAVPEQTVKALDAMGLTVSRVGGADRYATAVAINSVYASLFDGKSICAATGENYPDALTGSVFAAKNKAPVVLVPRTASGSDTAVSYIRDSKAEKVYVFGGSGAVSEETVSLMKNTE